MQQRVVVAVALAAMVAATAFAQQQARVRQGAGQQMRERRIQRLATILSLTDAQKQQASSIFTNAMQEAAAIRPSTRTAQTSLREAIKTNNVAQIDSSAEEVGRLQGQLRAIHAKAAAAFYALLTPEQRAKYDALRPGEGMRGPGPGMRPGPRGRRVPPQ